MYASCENTSFLISSVNKCTKFVNVVRLILVFSITNIYIYILKNVLYNPLIIHKYNLYQVLVHHDQENSLKVVETVEE